MLPEHFPATGLVAHRGLAASLPENTVPALTAALDAGTRLIEYDMQLSSDGVPMVYHDETLARTSGLEGRVGDFDASTLADTSAGYAGLFGDQFESITIPSHVEVVEALAAYDEACLVAEIKNQSIQRFGLRESLDPILDVLEPLRARTVLISFQPCAVAYAQARGFATGFCIEPHDDAAHATARMLKPDLLLTDADALRGPEDLWPGDWRWATWEIVDIERARSLFEMGVDYVETMACDKLQVAPSLSAHRGLGDQYRSL